MYYGMSTMWYTTENSGIASEFTHETDGRVEGNMSA